MVAILWLILVFLTGKYGEKRRTGFWGTMLLSALLSPIGGFLIALLAGKKEY